LANYPGNGLGYKPDYIHYGGMIGKGGGASSLKYDINKVKEEVDEENEAEERLLAEQNRQRKIKNEIERNHQLEEKRRKDEEIDKRIQDLKNITYEEFENKVKEEDKRIEEEEEKRIEERNREANDERERLKEEERRHNINRSIEYDLIRSINKENNSKRYIMPKHSQTTINILDNLQKSREGKLLKKMPKYIEKLPILEEEMTGKGFDRDLVKYTPLNEILKTGITGLNEIKKRDQDYLIQNYHTTDFNEWFGENKDDMTDDDYNDFTKVSQEIDIIDDEIKRIEKKKANVYIREDIKEKEAKEKEETKLVKKETEYISKVEKISTINAKLEIEKYWKETDEVILKEKDDVFIKRIYKEINDIVILDEPIEEEYKYKTLQKHCVDHEYGDKYLETLGINVNNLTKEERRKLYSSGKALEFSICCLPDDNGKKKFNSNAVKLFGIKRPEFEVTDFLVEKIFTKVLQELKKINISKLPSGSLAAQFCHDNIDIKNRIINEMKDYHANVNYENEYNMNIKLKKKYINSLKIKLQEEVKLYKYYNNEDMKKKTKEQLIIIKGYRDLLTNKDEFDKEFYRDNDYFGIPITMNKFQPIIIPSEEDYDGVTSLEILKIMKDNQGQKFIPEMKNKKIVSITQVGGLGDDYNKLMTKSINEDMIKNQHFEFTITVRSKNSICVYNYSKDKLADTNCILETYKPAYNVQKIKSDKTLNAVLIPIEKFVRKF
jgi:hypothetical protein